MSTVEPWLLKSLDGVRRGVAVDVGANVGHWTAMLAAEFERVVAIEPDRRAFASLIGSLPGNAEARHTAICGTNSPVRLRLRESPEQSSLLESHPIGGPGGCPAPAILEEIVDGCTLDAAFPLGADFVKIDIEGAEVEALGAATAGVWARATFLVECHDTFPEVAARLVAIGKKVELIVHPYPRAAHPGHCWAIGTPRLPI